MQKAFRLTFLLFFLSKLLLAQQPGDLDYVYTNLAEAAKRPTTVYHLDLSRQKLDEVPERVFSFKNLKSLNLSKNKISQLSPAIAGLSKLEELDLSYNRLSLLPYQFASLSKLTTLNLSKNSIKKLPENFGKLSSLQKLNLWANELESLPKSFGQLKDKLIELNLKSMVFDDKSVSFLKGNFPNTKIYLPDRCDCRP